MSFGTQLISEKDYLMGKGIAGLVLAAGDSKRMGVNNKLLLPFGKSSMIRTILQKMIESPIEEVFVVLGHQHEILREEIEGMPVRSINNPNYKEGMGTSISAGVRKLDSLGYEACLLCLGDLPLLEKGHFQRMVEAYLTNKEKLAYVPFYNGKQGHPLVFKRPLFSRLMDLKSDKGAKRVLNEVNDKIFRLDFDDRAGLADVDTYKEYLRLQENDVDQGARISTKKERNQAAKLIEGKDFYFNDEGLMVLMEEYHLKRGYCCKSACKHCPYGYRRSSMP